MAHFELSPVTSNSPLTPPAQLWIGPHDGVLHEVEQYLQKKFCAQGGCAVCGTCEQLRKQQHHAASWIMPEKGYTLEDLEVIFETTSLALNEGEQFFFILQKADLLTTSCANRLLKILEEPPRGYHFILLSERSSAILPTIRSRCTITSFFSEHESQAHEKLFSFFKQEAFQDPSDFLKELEASKINEQESAELLDLIIGYWIQQHRMALKNNNDTHQKVSGKKVALFSKALLVLPMPGSSKIFWKNLFVQNG